MRVLEVPNVLLILALLYPFGRRTSTAGAVAAMGAGGFLLWAVGSQQTRFLLPVFPALAVAAAAVLLRAVEKVKGRRWLSAAGVVLLAVPVAGAVFWSAYLVWYAGPLPVVIGAEPKLRFLERRVSDFTAIQYIMQELTGDDRVLMMWDGEGYYCDARCLPDTDQSQWVRMAASRPPPRELAAEMRRAGISHVLFSHDSDAIVEEHDPRGAHRAARDYFLNEFAPVCTKLEFRGGWADLLEISCGGESG